MSALRNLVLQVYDNLLCLRGSIFVVVCTLSYSVVSTGISYTSRTFNQFQIVLWLWVAIFNLSAVAMIFNRPQLSQSTYVEIFLIAIDGLFVALGSVSFHFAVILINPGNATNVFYTLPVIVLVLETISNRQLPRCLHCVLTLTTAVGVVFVVKPTFIFGHSEDGEDINLTGVVLSLLSSVFYAFYVKTTETLAQYQNHSPLLVLFMSSVFSIIICLSLCMFGHAPIVPDSWKTFATFSAIGLSVFIGQFFLTLASATEKPIVVSILLSTEVLFTFLFQCTILRIPLSWPSCVGGVIIVISCIGIAVSNHRDISDERPQQEEERPVVEWWAWISSYLEIFVSLP